MVCVCMGREREREREREKEKKKKKLLWFDRFQLSQTKVVAYVVPPVILSLAFFFHRFHLLVSNPFARVSIWLPLVSLAVGVGMKVL